MQRYSAPPVHQLRALRSGSPADPERQGAVQLSWVGSDGRLRAIFVHPEDAAPDVRFDDVDSAELVAVRHARQVLAEALARHRGVPELVPATEERTVPVEAA